MTKEIFKLPMYELTLQDAVFIHKDIIVFPNNRRILSDTLIEAVKFLFGEDAYVEKPCTNDYPILTIKQADFKLRDTQTINAAWYCKEIK